MCGIVGYTGKNAAAPILLAGLAKLEYRGYDSAGISVQEAAGLQVVRRRGKVSSLAHTVEHFDLEGSCGIGHTRWATHGRPSEANAHPHSSCDRHISIVHNGIIENFTELREELESAGHQFTSETDTEVIAHLVEDYYDGDLLAAVRQASVRLVGSYGLAAVCDREPGVIVVTRKDSPIIVGHGEDGSYVASDAIALIEATRDVVVLSDGQLARLTAEGVAFFDTHGIAIDPEITHITWDMDVAEKGGYPDFMLKEIHEQPRVIRDTLAAIRDARIKGARVFGITNVLGSPVARESDGVIYTKANKEIAVASTKSFLGQVVSLTLLAMLLAQAKGKLRMNQIRLLFRELADTAEQVERILVDTTAIEQAAHACVDAASALFIGRGMGAAVAKEGALKLKEISYLHAEAYPAGEMKHGPIALIDEGFPVIAVATASPVYDKVISNLQESKARGARIVAIATEGDESIRDHVDHVIYIPKVNDKFSAITASVPLQLLARAIAVERGCDVDQPRNLAKSVTVE